MELMALMAGRRSVRRFRSDPVAPDRVELLVQAMGWAPSWRNLQGWRLFVVSGKKKEELLAAVPETNRGRRGLEEAPLALVLVADPEQSGTREHKPYYLFDAGLAFAHLALAAWNEGLGTCCIGWFKEDVVRSVLKLPAHLSVVALSP
ncbi:MAG TPA: nitroreductase, partial [Firmicutes bacterium]|nr:nitroreductase [Bacillota bacterium]